MSAYDATAIGTLPEDWRVALGPRVSDDMLAGIASKVADARGAGAVYPPAEEVFAALTLTPFADVRAVIIGQDPYHGPGQAHGLAFSVCDGVRPLPPSLRNIRRELQSNLGTQLPASGSLTRWAEHGVLLLNAILTVSSGVAGSHNLFGWQRFTQAVIESIAAREDPLAFLLWGSHAEATAGAIDETRHVVVHAAHPSPQVRSGFLGTKPFSTANEGLRRRGMPEIDWALE